MNPSSNPDSTVRRVTFTSREDDKPNRKPIPPGDRRLLVGRSQSVFRPESLELVGVAKGEARESRCALRAIQLAGEEQPRTDAPGNAQSLNLRDLAVAETIGFIVENVGSEPEIVRAALSGKSMEMDEPRSCILPLEVRDLPGPTCTRLEIPAGAEVCLPWRSLWVYRVHKVWIRSDSLADVDVLDVKVGSRNQMIHWGPVSAAHFARGKSLDLDTLAVGQSLILVMKNIDAERAHWVEIEVEGVVALEAPFIPDTDIRDFPIDLSTDEAPAGDFAVRKTAEVDFSGQRLVIVTPDHFNVRDLKIAGKSQLANSTDLPADVFAPQAVGIRLKLDEVKVGSEIEILMTNRGAARPFRACLLGTSKLRKYEPMPVPKWAEERALEVIRETPAFRMLAHQIAFGS